MDPDEKFENYDMWMSNEIPIMVATSESFGLGIVKPEVKFVIHTSAPSNLRAYYQVYNLNFITIFIIES